MQIIKNEGFNVLQVKFDKQSSIIRHLYVKSFISNSLIQQRKNSDHDLQQQQECKAENCTLFILNIPPFINEQHIRYLFEKCGKIVRVFFDEKPSFQTATSMLEKIQKLDSKTDQQDKSAIPLGFSSSVFEENEIFNYKICHVVFAKLSALSNALDMAGTDHVYTFVPDEIDPDDKRWFTGIKLWQSRYNNSVIEQYHRVKLAEKFVAEMDEQSDEQQKRIEAEQQQSIEQESGGWITVNRNLRRNRRALIANQQHDRLIEEKLKDRQMKRKLSEQKFDEQIAPIIEAAQKKKKKNPRTIHNNF